jgi:hypothetical protein
MEAANYTLAQTAPAGTTFLRWECYNISNGTAVLMPNSTAVNLAANMSVTCVAVYALPASPSPRWACCIASEQSVTGKPAAAAGAAAGPAADDDDADDAAAAAPKLAVQVTTCTTQAQMPCNQVLFAASITLRKHAL